MPEQLFKLTPCRDLQCYFLMPSAIAALSDTSDTQFTLSGTWRQQFDWAVVEWNRDNVFEHPALRNLPDGDLSGLTLSYRESRTNCIPFESNLFPTVDWPNLRIWANDANGMEQVYFVALKNYAQPLTGTSTISASATLTLTGKATPGDLVGIWMPTPVTNTTGTYQEQHYYYIVSEGDTLVSVASRLAAVISSQSQGYTATGVRNAPSLTLTWKPTGVLNYDGSNGNRITVYTYTNNKASVSWTAPAATLNGGAFPSTHQVTLNFGTLQGFTRDINGNASSTLAIPTHRVRKVRWTWAADMQVGAFQRTSFRVDISNWTVTGTNRGYLVAGPGSRRIQDTDATVNYGGWWAQPPPSLPVTNNKPLAIQAGNYSGSRIRYTDVAGDDCTINYTENAPHQLYLGSRRTPDVGTVSVAIDGAPAQNFSLTLNGEDVLVRVPLGAVAAGTHTVVITNPQAAHFFFDFLEIAYPSADLPDFAPHTQLSFATDWDTYHGQSLAPERTAWLIQKLGFAGHVNHYVGAIWFYDLVLPGHIHNSATVTFSGSPGDNQQGALSLSVGPDSNSLTAVTHLVLPSDTPATVAQAFANLINLGFTQVFASASGNQLTVTQRALTTPAFLETKPPAQILLSVNTQLKDVTPSTISASVSSDHLIGGVAGEPYDSIIEQTADPLTHNLWSQYTSFWRTDWNATLNQAAIDWHAAYFKAIKGYGMDVVTAFSTELQHADPNVSAGIAQRHYGSAPDASDGPPLLVATPAVMTNFSPSSITFWTNMYLTAAALQQAAGLTPYLQSGEVQWWYYPSSQAGALAGKTTSMPFYDSYTQSQFHAKYGVPMKNITTNDPDVTGLTNEITFLPTLIGNYTAAIRTALQAKYPGCRYEILYPNDTNSTAFNQLINFPADDWTPANLTALKTESFQFTGGYDLDLSAGSISVSAAKGFPNQQRSHLVGIGDAQAPWMREVNRAIADGLENVVLFALDQYCLIGYAAPPFVEGSRSLFQG